MQKSGKDIFIKKYNFHDGDSFSEEEREKSKKNAKSGKQKKYIYLHLKEIFKNHSENFPPLYLVDRRDKTENSNFKVEKRQKQTDDRRKSHRRKNNFDRRHPQNSDEKFSFTEEDRRSEFSDRRDWLDFERRKIDKRKVIQSIQRISEIIADYKAPQSKKNSKDKGHNIPNPDEMFTAPGFEEPGEPKLKSG